jgi:hypothetical protein
VAQPSLVTAELTIGSHYTLTYLNIVHLIHCTWFTLFYFIFSSLVSAIFVISAASVSNYFQFYFLMVFSSSLLLMRNEVRVVSDISHFIFNFMIITAQLWLFWMDNYFQIYPLGAGQCVV